MPEHTFGPGVLAEIKQERETRNRKAEEERTDVRLRALASRLSRLESQPRSNPGLALNEDFCREIAAIFRSYVDVKFGKLKNENEAIMNRLKYLETQPLPDYKGVYEPGANYPKNSLVTYEGSLWIERSTTGSAPGNPGGSDWKMCVKRGRDGKDGKDWRETAPAKGW